MFCISLRNLDLTLSLRGLPVTVSIPFLCVQLSASKITAAGISKSLSAFVPLILLLDAS